MINHIESLKITVYHTRMLYQRYTGITFEMLSDLKVKNLKPQCKFSAYFALIYILFCTKVFGLFCTKQPIKNYQVIKTPSGVGARNPVLFAYN